MLQYLGAIQVKLCNCNPRSKRPTTTSAISTKCGRRWRTREEEKEKEALGCI